MWWFQEPRQSGKILLLMFSVCKDASLSQTVHSMKSSDLIIYQNVKVFIFVILMYFVFLLFKCVSRQRSCYSVLMMSSCSQPWRLIKFIQYMSLNMRWWLVKFVFSF